MLVRIRTWFLLSTWKVSITKRGQARLVVKVYKYSQNPDMSIMGPHLGPGRRSHDPTIILQDLVFDLWDLSFHPFILLWGVGGSHP
jgi:hypothetical protein